MDLWFSTRTVEISRVFLKSIEVEILKYQVMLINLCDYVIIKVTCIILTWTNEEFLRHDKFSKRELILRNTTNLVPWDIRKWSNTCQYDGYSQKSELTWNWISTLILESYFLYENK